MYINPVSLMWRYWIFIFLGKYNSKKDWDSFFGQALKKDFLFFCGGSPFKSYVSLLYIIPNTDLKYFRFVQHGVLSLQTYRQWKFVLL